MKELFSGRFRVTHDEVCRKTDNYPGESKNDPCLMELKCAGKGVTIYPFSDTHLALEINHRPGLVNRVSHLQLWQDGDREKTFLFPIEMFEEIAAIVKPRARRVLSEIQRERLVNLGREHRFVRNTC